MNALLKFAALWTALLVLMTPCLAQKVQHPPQTEKSVAEAGAIVQAASQLVQSGEFEEAEPVAIKAVQLAPSSAAAHNLPSSPLTFSRTSAEQLSQPPVIARNSQARNL
jgi:Tfp pilus assembly protein PilF